MQATPFVEIGYFVDTAGYTVAWTTTAPPLRPPVRGAMGCARSTCAAPLVPAVAREQRASLTPPYVSLQSGETLLHRGRPGARRRRRLAGVLGVDVNVGGWSEHLSGRRGPAGSHLLVRAGEYVCALPLRSVRRVLRALTVHPLPGAAAELKGLAEFAGEPLAGARPGAPGGAPPGANPAYPVTIVVWVGPEDARELVGLAADAALEVAEVAARLGGGGDGGFILGEAMVDGEVVRVVDLEALGGER